MSKFALILIIAIAAFFRLWQLDSIPPGLYPDVAMNGNNALDALKTGGFKVFYPENNGREGLMMWLIAFSFSIFGVSVWSIKIVSAIIGILTVWGLYLLTKELFYRYEKCSHSVALLASFFLAVSFWHTIFSRIGFRAISLPFTLTFAFYFLFFGFRKKNILPFIVSGIFFGLGFYTYTTYRLIILLLPLLLFCWPFYQNKKRYLLYTGSFLLTALIVAMPLGIYFLQNPQDLFSRSVGISIFSQPDIIKAFFESLGRHLIMFNISGDQNWRHNFAGSSQLFWPVGIFFLIGAALSAKHFIIGLKNKDHYLLMAPVFLFSLFFVMLLGSILTYEGIPHALRSIGVIPPVFVFVGLGSYWMYEKLKQIIKNGKLLLAICFLTLAVIGYAEFNKYFSLWAKKPKVSEAFAVNYADAGYFLNSVPDDVPKYVIVNEPDSPLYGISIPAQTLMFIESAKFGKPRANYITFENLDSIKTGRPHTAIVSLYNGKTLDELRKRFPQGVVKISDGILFYLVYE